MARVTAVISRMKQRPILKTTRFQLKRHGWRQFLTVRSQGQEAGRTEMANHPAEFFEGTEMPTAGWWEALWPDPAGVLAAVGLEAGMDVIDLCSGDGWFTLQIAKIARRVTAIDIDRDLLDLARHRLAEAGVGNCMLVRGNAYDVAALAGARVDFVFMANAFHGVP